MTEAAAVTVCASCKAPCSELSSAGNCEYCRLRLSSLRRYSYETTRELRRVTKPDPHAISAIAAASADPYEDGDCYELPNAEWP